MRRKTHFLAMTLAVTGLCALAEPAFAAFTVCNKTNLPVRTAVGHFDGTNWTSEGWWAVQPNACVPILTGPLQGRFYYLYASDRAAGIWEGKTHFCVAPEKRFRSVGRSGCAKRGFDRRGFFEIDTGKKPDWTQSLSN